VLQVDVVGAVVRRHNLTKVCQDLWLGGIRRFPSQARSERV
jgi:hypothetical protein